MKTLALFLLLASTAWAGDVTLSWDASPTASVTGYMVYYGNSPDNLNYSVDAGNALKKQIKGLSSGDWYFAATAYDQNNESVKSNMVNTNIAGFEPSSAPHITVEKPATVTIKITVE